MDAMRDIISLLPSLTLIFTAVAALLSEVTYHGEKKRLIGWISFLGVSAALLQTLPSFSWVGESVLGGSLKFDGLTLLFQVLFLLGAMGVLLILPNARGMFLSERGEYAAFIALSVLFASWGVASTDLFTTFLCLQFWLLSVVFLICFSRSNPDVHRASWIGFWFALLSVLFFGFGIALLFSQFGTLNLTNIETQLHSNTAGLVGGSPSSLVPVILISLSLLIPFTAFPMFGWFSQVLNAAPSPTSVWMSWAGQALALGIWSRLEEPLFRPLLGDAYSHYLTFIVVFTGITFIMGALHVFLQDRMRSVFSSLAVLQGAFMLFSISFHSSDCLTQVIFFLLVQWTSWIGLFLATEWVQAQVGSDSFDDLSKLSPTHWVEAGCLLFFLASLIGLPPTVGFQSRFFLLITSLHEKNLFLVLVSLVALALCSVIFAKLSYSLVGSFFVRKESQPAQAVSGKIFHSPRILLGALLVPNLLLLIYAQPILAWIRSNLP